jgi:hypothetical protein
MHQLLIELANYVGKAWANEWLKKPHDRSSGQGLESAGEAGPTPPRDERKPLHPVPRTALPGAQPATPPDEPTIDESLGNVRAEDK